MSTEKPEIHNGQSKLEISIASNFISVCYSLDVGTPIDIFIIIEPNIKKISNFEIRKTVYTEPRKLNRMINAFLQHF